MKNNLSIAIVMWFLFVGISSEIAKGQFPSSIKENYDKNYFNSNLSPVNPDYADCSTTGNQLSWILSSLLRMYQSTHDKSYLVKFMNHSIKIQSKRWDERGFPAEPVWVRPDDHGSTCNGNSDEKVNLHITIVL